MRLSWLFALSLFASLAHAEPITHVGGLHFDSTLTARDRAAFQNLTRYLESHPLGEQDSELLGLMKIKDGAAATVRAWIEERVQYIVTDRTADSRIKLAGLTYDYENPGVLPPVLTLPGDSPKPDYLGPADTVGGGEAAMTNVGLAFYLNNKRAGNYYTLDADGLGTLPITSPRIGVVQIHEDGFYMMPASQKELTNIFQLGMLLHEARHSDGHGEQTGFQHMLCPAGHTYAGLPACDPMLNGGYSIQARALKALTQSCASCDSAAKLELTMLWADNASRVIQTPQTTNWDDAPEGHR